MNGYTTWEFWLNGEAQDFRQLTEKPGTDYLNIYGGVDDWNDCPSDDFRMNSLYCEGESDPSVVWQIGHELLSLFNGASELMSRHYQKASIAALLHNDVSLAYVPPQGSPGLLGAPPFPQYRLDEELKNAKQSSPRLQLIHLATENEDVYFILKYLDMEAGWVTYYKLLEAVEGFAKKKAIDLGLDSKKRNIFTNTSNNFSLSGFDARHGFKEMTKQNKTPSMTIDEGHKFVTDLVKKFLNLAYIK